MLAAESRAQRKNSPALIGWLSTFAFDSTSRDLPDFKEALALLGRRDGIEVIIETRWAGSGEQDRLRPLAAQLAAMKPAVIVTYNISATRAAASATTGIPIVQANGGSLVERGLAASYARPGGLITGLTNLSSELSEKLTEFLFDLVPKLQRVGYLIDRTVVTTSSPTFDSAKRVAARLKLEAVFGEVANPQGFEPAFALFRQRRVQGVVVLPSLWFGPERHRIAKLALREQLPAVAAGLGFAEAGTLIAHGPVRSYAFRRAAWYVDQILKGVKPGDLPIEQPSKIELVVNLKTAKALGITVPPIVMARADRVIE